MVKKLEELTLEKVPSWWYVNGRNNKVPGYIIMTNPVMSIMTIDKSNQRALRATTDFLFTSFTCGFHTLNIYERQVILWYKILNPKVLNVVVKQRNPTAPGVLHNFSDTDRFLPWWNYVFSLELRTPKQYRKIGAKKVESKPWKLTLLTT